MHTIDATVILVDDDPNALHLLNRVLSDAGFRVLVANSGEAALETLTKVTANVMLLDAQMPGMDGFETCQQVKHTQPDLPVIFMTGLSETKHMVAGFDAGGVDYLIKPINHQELLARVKVHINNAQVTQKTKAALDHTGQYLMALDDSGQIQWQTPEAQKLLAALTSKDRELVSHWLKDPEANDALMIQQGETTFHLTLLSDDSEPHHLIKIKSQNLITEKQTLKNKLKITRREAEVLFWVSQGKTDWEISKILSISDRTVNKHLQQIYRKLGVNNRTAATTQALLVLN